MCKVDVLKLQANKCSAVTEFFYFSVGVDEIFICLKKGEVRILSNGGKTCNVHHIMEKIRFQTMEFKGYPLPHFGLA